MRSFGETPGKREALLNKLVKISETPVKREETPEKGEEPKFMMITVDENRNFISEVRSWFNILQKKCRLR